MITDASRRLVCYDIDRYRLVYHYAYIGIEDIVVHQIVLEPLIFVERCELWTSYLQIGSTVRVALETCF